MDNRGEVRAYSEVGEIVFYLAERGEQLVPSTVHGGVEERGKTGGFTKDTIGGRRGKGKGKGSKGRKQ